MYHDLFVSAFAPTPGGYSIPWKEILRILGLPAVYVPIEDSCEKLKRIGLGSFRLNQKDVKNSLCFKNNEFCQFFTI
jgi:hypothetical protein